MEFIFAQEEFGGAELLFYPVFKNEKKILSLIRALKYEDETAIIKRLKKEKFSGDAGQTFVVIDDRQIVILIGSGQETQYGVSDWRNMAAIIGRELKQYSAKSMAIEVRYWLKGSRDIKLLAQTLVEGIYLATYNFSKYKKKPVDGLQLAKVYIDLTGADRKKFSRAWDRGMAIVGGTNLARDMVNEPANVVTPSFIADTAKQIASSNKAIKLKVIEEEQARRMGMHAYLAVDQGSAEPAKFIHLVYKPAGRLKGKLALVGKGITFDSGGLNLKPEKGMEDMKVDMSGAATVLGVFQALAQLDIKIEVHGIIAACENMVSSKSFRPGDVIKSMKGPTIEIGNTDAEGRVTLADSLAYAQKQGLKTIIDLATLTGAVVVALGNDYAGLFSNNNKLAKSIMDSAARTDENFWRLPLVRSYRKLNDSKIADVRNIPSTRMGGAITAALFLQEFIDDDVAWAHLDIAGPAHTPSPLNAYSPAGGVGFGVRTLVDYLSQ